MHPAIGPYVVLSKLGEGGMGAVYRARDTKLNRDVALKVLLPAVAGDAERLARFGREAQVLASLNHSRIATIYGLESFRSDGSSDPSTMPPSTIALVMELVEGEDLSARIARGALPRDEALPIARQIAEALEAAHEQGIVHRDLKPANIKVRPDGTVKVLDFGLAKAMETPGSRLQASGQAVTQSPTITSPAQMTGVGVILGTAAYMSPEQAAGKPVDKRTDLWAFGVVLLEMLTGRRVYRQLTLAPDGTRLALTVVTPGQQDIWVYDTGRDTMSRVTFEQRANIPTWARSGRHIVFNSGNDVWQALTDGSSPPQLLLQSSRPLLPSDFSPDGKWLICTQTARTAGTPSMLALPIDDDGSRLTAGTPVAVPGSANPGARERVPAFSPDGREERGPSVSQKRLQARATKMIQALRSLGYRVEPAPDMGSAL